MVVPLYQKISDDLKENITSRKIKVGDKLPTEMELADSYKVSRITAKRALNELEQLGLVSRTRGKGSFVKNSTESQNSLSAKSILFIQPFGDLGFGDFIQSLIPFMKAEGYTVFITHSDYLEEADAATIQQSFAGLIYYPMNTDEYLDKLSELAFQQFPIVLLDKEIYGLSLPCVMSDNHAGGLLAAQHLIELGHKKIGFIMLDEIHHPHTVKSRYLGYIHALSEARLTFHTLYTDPNATSRNVAQFVKENGITGIVCENDLIAMQVMANLQVNGYDIPNDISVIGFDNIQAAQLSNPPLTTIEQNFAALGVEAGKLLMGWITMGRIPSNTQMPVQLIKRKSTKELI